MAELNFYVIPTVHDQYYYCMKKNFWVNNESTLQDLLVLKGVSQIKLSIITFCVVFMYLLYKILVYKPQKFSYFIRSAPIWINAPNSFLINLLNLGISLLKITWPYIIFVFSLDKEFSKVIFNYLSFIFNVDLQLITEFLESILTLLLDFKVISIKPQVIYFFIRGYSNTESFMSTAVSVYSLHDIFICFTFIIYYYLLFETLIKICILLSSIFSHKYFIIFEWLLIYYYIIVAPLFIILAVSYYCYIRYYPYIYYSFANSFIVIHFILILLILFIFCAYLIHKGLLIKKLK